jgi:predicted aldo/keto reductase-like oxidoreductase
MDQRRLLSTSLPPVFRLGLATRGNTHLSKESVLYALDQGINYWNWCGHPDGMSQAYRQLGRRRETVVLATQLAGRSAQAIQKEVEASLRELRADRLDVATFYYVEREQEWQEILAKGGALEGLIALKEKGQVGLIGVTSHQRRLLSQMAQEGVLDLLMVRYNAAHRGAETEVFPAAQKRGVKIVVFTCLRWRSLLSPTPEDPADFRVPLAREWYRFVLAHPAVDVALMAPDNARELEENLALLADWRPPTPEEYAQSVAHGDRVHRYKPEFP